MSEPEQETIISTYLISTVAEWRLWDPKGNKEFKGDAYMNLFRQRVTD